jgi:hypothetical protein
MATESLQFFMRPEEFREVVRRLRARLQFHVILHRFFPPILELAKEDGLTLSDGSDPDSLFLTTDKPQGSQMRSPHEVNGAAWGWVEIDVPRERDGVLYLAQMGAKSDWYDEAADAVRENSDGPSLFRKIARELSGELAGPTWARNVVYGGEEAYPSILYSPGAAELAGSGGELRQPDVDNIVFSINPSEPTHE